MEIEITAAYTVFNWHLKLSFKGPQRLKKKKKQQQQNACQFLQFLKHSSSRVLYDAFILGTFPQPGPCPVILPESNLISVWGCCLLPKVLRRRWFSEMKSELGLACLIFNTCLKHVFNCHGEIWQFMGEVLGTKDQQWAFPAHTHSEHAVIWASLFPRAKHSLCNKKTTPFTRHQNKPHHSFLLGTPYKDIDACRNK